MIRLDGLSAIRNFFRQDPTPIYFVNETPITLIGLDAWVHGLMFLCRIDAFDGLHPRDLASGEVRFFKGKRNIDVFLCSQINSLIPIPKKRRGEGKDDGSV